MATPKKKQQNSTARRLHKPGAGAPGLVMSCESKHASAGTAPFSKHGPIAGHMQEILKSLGEDTSREGLLDTPKRYAKAMEFLTSGYGREPSDVIGDALFAAEGSNIVIVRDIELFSLCEHHLLPFYGKAHVAYIPDGKIIGLSKIPRIVDVFARRLQVQERLTTQVSEALMEALKPLGVAVIIEAYHFCMMMRGVEKQNSYTLTSSMLGAFRDSPVTRQELLHLLGGLGGSRRV